MDYLRGNPAVDAVMRLLIARRRCEKWLEKYCLSPKSRVLLPDFLGICLEEMLPHKMDDTTELAGHRMARVKSAYSELLYSVRKSWEMHPGLSSAARLHRVGIHSLQLWICIIRPIWTLLFAPGWRHMAPFTCCDAWWSLRCNLILLCVSTIY